MIVASHGIIGSQIVQATGLLAEYTGAAAAYSLRQLTTAYTGSAIRVRRASDNTEQDIGFVGGELDTSTLTTFCSATDGFVKTWYDQSGNGRDATQTTSANQPQIVSSGSVVLENGKPAVQFDGSNDSLQNNVYKLNPVPFTILATVQFDTASGFKFLFDQSEGSTAGALFSKEDNKYRFYYYTDLINLQLYNTATNTQELATLIVDDGLQTFHVNSISRYSESTPVPNNPVPTYNFVIGADPDSGVRYFQGNLQELIIYPSDQSFNRTGIETNINDFYSIY